MRMKIKEVTVVGTFGFVAPFLGCAALARFVLGWNGPASWLAGIALSTTSMAVVYAVMLEFGFNKTEYGKGILGECFINDLGTVIALGVMFAPFTYRTVVFVGASVVLIALLPSITSRLIAHYGNRTAAIRTKWILLVLCGMGALALWSGNEAVLPAYIAGMVLAKEHRPRQLLRPPLANADRRLSDSLLFSPRRLAGFAARVGVRPVGVPGPLFGENRLESLRPLSRNRHLPRRRQGTMVLHPAHVDGIDLRHDFSPLRADAPDRHPGTVFVPGRGGDRQRGDSDADRQRRLSAANTCCRICRRCAKKPRNWRPSRSAATTATELKKNDRRSSPPESLGTPGHPPFEAVAHTPVRNARQQYEKFSTPRLSGQQVRSNARTRGLPLGRDKPYRGHSRQNQGQRSQRNAAESAPAHKRPRERRESPAVPARRPSAASSR